MNTPNSIPPQKLAELIKAMQMARDDLISASLLLRDLLDETDEVSREQARQLGEQLIRQSRGN